MPDELYYDDDNLPQFLSNANRFTNDAVYSSKSERSHSKKVIKKDKKKSRKAKKVSRSPPVVKVPRAKPIKIQKSFPPKPKAELAAEKAIIMEKFNAKTRKEARAEEKEEQRNFLNKPRKLTEWHVSLKKKQKERQKNKEKNTFKL